MRLPQIATFKPFGPEWQFSMFRPSPAQAWKNFLAS
jgi:hypothetical protein